MRNTQAGMSMSTAAALVKNCSSGGLKRGKRKTDLNVVIHFVYNNAYFSQRYLAIIVIL